MSGFSHRLAACAVASFLLVGAASADVVRRHSLATAGVRELVVTSDVGEIDLRAGSSDRLEVEVTLHNRKSGLFSRRADLSKADILIKRSGDALELSLEDDNLAGDWIIRTPASGIGLVSIHQGVGDIDASPGASDVAIALGVGDVRLTTKAASAGDINLAVGVGDAEIKGAQSAGLSRFVGVSGHAKGRGSSSIDVSIGVGDADIRLD
jgi:hypothetical protein